MLAGLCFKGKDQAGTKVAEIPSGLAQLRALYEIPQEVATPRGQTASRKGFPTRWDGFLRYIL